MKAVALIAVAVAGLVSVSAQNIFVHGELRQSHKVTLTLEGPQVSAAKLGVDALSNLNAWGGAFNRNREELFDEIADPGP